MPAQPDYVPAKDADFNAWAVNFDSLLTASPTTYGQTAPTAVAVAAVVATWTGTYALAIDPITRTSVTVAAKDAARAAAEATMRPVAVSTSRNMAVSNANKTALGVNIPNFTPVPIPPPVTFPQLALDFITPGVHTIRYQDSGLGTGKKKPFGSINVMIYRAVGLLPAIDPLQAVFNQCVTKAPFRSTFVAGENGKMCTYFARYMTQSGPGGEAQFGPWSAPLTVTVVS